QGLELPNYLVTAAAAFVVIVAVVALPKILGHRSDSSSSAATAAVQPAARPDSVEKPTRRETPPAPKPSAPAAVQNSLKAAAEKKPTAEPRSSAVITPTPTSATVRTDTFPSANAPSHSGSSSARAEVLEQVLPDASENALATIHGVVRVGVRVQVDPTGNVAEARLDSPGPSKYFAGLALKAARRWQFTSPEVGGHSVPSEWLIRFHSWDGYDYSRCRLPRVVGARMGQSRVILLDTHAVLWLTTDPAKLLSKAKSAIEDARKSGGGLAISDITLLELATLASKGRIRLGISLESFLQDVETRFVFLPLSSPA